MTTRRDLVASGLLTTVLAFASAIPWLAYGIGLSQIDGRPTHATHTVSAEEKDGLLKKLRIPQPAEINPISPYSYLSYLLQHKTIGASGRIAWIIARSHNIEHLSDHRYWHLSGAALTIWLTRNWTPTELIARAVELETGISSATPQ
jgi:hypothetical protein